MRAFSLAALAGVSSAALNNLQFKFMQWMVEHNKAYETVGEYEYRFSLWEAAEHEINAWNM